MSWGIDFNADIFLSHQDYSENIYQVEDKINSNTEAIQDCITKLSMIASSTDLKGIVPKDYQDEPIDWIQVEVKQQVEMLKEYFVENKLLELYKEYLIEKNESKNKKTQ